MLQSPQVRLMRRAFDCAVEVAQPAHCLTRALSKISEPGPAVVLAVGKAAASMALTFKQNWPEPIRGFAVTRYAHGLRAGEDAAGIEIVEAGHPSPDSASVAAGTALLKLAKSVRSDEQLYCLVSGGGSALAAAPLAPLTFEQKRAAADYLIRAGADIREINCVRKHLSAIKGGRLAAAAHPRPVSTYAISDIPGDDLAAIASGPTIADPTTQTDALKILTKYDYPERVALEVVLQDPANETPKPDAAVFLQNRAEIVATAADALTAARKLLEDEGYRVIYLGDDIDDEARQLGHSHAQLALSAQTEGDRVALLSGGETRVVIRKSGGRGGRNLEYLGGLAEGLNDAAGIFAIAADTDGIDGNGGHAGGFVLPGGVAAARAEGIELADVLNNNDCYRYFAATDSLIETGPTRTNVNDFRLILCHS